MMNHVQPDNYPIQPVEYNMPIQPVEYNFPIQPVEYKILQSSRE